MKPIARFLFFCISVGSVLLFKSFAYSFPQSDLLMWLAENNTLLLYSALGFYTLALGTFLFSVRSERYSTPAYILVLLSYAFSQLEIGYVASVFEAVQFASLVTLVIAEVRFRQYNLFFSATLLLTLGMRAVSYVRFLEFEAGTQVLFLITAFILMIYALQRHALQKNENLARVYLSGLGKAFTATFISLFFSYAYGGLLLMMFYPENLRNSMSMNGFSLLLAMALSCLVTWFASGNTKEFATAKTDQDS